MNVYGEVLFIENFITGWIILVLTARLRGYKLDKLRIATGSVMCGGFAFILFVPLHWLMTLVSKLLFSVVIVLVVFGAKTLRNVVKTAGVFYVVSFLMGGTTIALMYMLKIPGMTGNGSFIFKGVTFLQITAGIAVTWYLGSWLAGLLREKVLQQQVLHQVTVQIAGNEWQLKGMVDTGNSLVEPVTGWPVAVLSKSQAEKIRRICDSEQFAKISVIPYRTVGVSGIMFGVRPDRIIIDGCETHKIVLGFGERNFSPWQGTEKYDLLLHQQFLMGEEDDYGKKYDDGQDSSGSRKCPV